MKRALIAFWAVIFSAMAVFSFLAVAKGDTIELVNGNKIYGKCMYLDKEYMGTVDTELGDPHPERVVYKLDIVTLEVRGKEIDVLRVRFSNGGQTFVKLKDLKDATPDDKDLFEMRKKEEPDESGN